MTDYTKLIERLDTELLWTLNYEAQDAIQALQEENALLEGTLESRGRNIAEMQAENERLKRELEISKLDAKEWYSQADALQAKLDAMGKGEPVGWFVDVTVHGKSVGDFQLAAREYWGDYSVCQPLYAAPKALAPLTDEQCDQVAAQTMDAVAKARDMHALDLNPNIQEHHTLRRELIRAGFAIGIGG